jgi:hypothetical protein
MTTNAELKALCVAEMSPWTRTAEEYREYRQQITPARIIALVDENERLREALNGIVDGDADYLTDAQNIARHALATGEGE